MQPEEWVFGGERRHTSDKLDTLQESKVHTHRLRHAQPDSTDHGTDGKQRREIYRGPRMAAIFAALFVVGQSHILQDRWVLLLNR